MLTIQALVSVSEVRRPRLVPASTNGDPLVTAATERFQGVGVRAPAQVERAIERSTGGTADAVRVVHVVPVWCSTSARLHALSVPSSLDRGQVSLQTFFALTRKRSPSASTMWSRIHTILVARSLRPEPMGLCTDHLGIGGFASAVAVHCLDAGSRVLCAAGSAVEIGPQRVRVVREGVQPVCSTEDRAGYRKRAAALAARPRSEFAPRVRDAAARYQSFARSLGPS